MYRFTSNKLSQVIFKKTLEAGLLDFHKSTLTVLKIHYKKQKPLVVTYRDYKNFSNKTFRTELLCAMERYSNISFADFHWVSMHQPRKDASKLTGKTLWAKNLISQSWLGLSFVISF